MLATERWQINTLAVLERVYEERLRQVAQYGHNETLEDGTGPGAQWLKPYSDDAAALVQERFRQDYETREMVHGLPTWLHLVREELAEAAETATDDELIAELVQVAALCVSWIEKKLRV